MRQYPEMMIAAAFGDPPGVAVKAGRIVLAGLPAQYEGAAPQMPVPANDSYIQNMRGDAVGTEAASHD